MSEDNTKPLPKTIGRLPWPNRPLRWPPRPQPARKIFKELSGTAASGGLAKDIDFILDIPVLLTVELGRTKITSRTCCSWRRDRWSSSTASRANRWTCWSTGCLIAQGEVVVVNDKFAFA